MRRLSILAGFVLLSAACAWGKSYVVTAKGEGVWASRVRTATNVVIYYVAEGGNTEQTCNLSDLAGVVPTVERGRQYSEQEISDAIAAVDKLAQRFLPLRKQLIILNQQWMALRTPEVGVEDKINKLAREFEASSKDSAIFRDVSLRMEMIRFKDVSGRYSNQVEVALTRIGSAYFEANRGKVDQLLSGPETSIAHFLECKKEVDTLKLGHLSAEQKQQLDKALQKCCDATVKAGIEAARQALFAAKTVDSFLESAAALRELKQATAENANPKDVVEKAIYSLRAAAIQALPGYDCSVKGCPLSENDRKLLVDFKKFASSMPVRSLETDEQAYMFPTKAPAQPEGDTFRLPLRIVFNRTQPKDRVHILGGEIRAEGEDKPKTFLWRIPALEIRDGHAEVTLEAPAARLIGTEVSIFLAYKDNTVKAGEPDKWIALSLGCRIPVGKAR